MSNRPITSEDLWSVVAIVFMSLLWANALL